MTSEYQRGYQDGFREGMTRSRLINWQDLQDMLEEIERRLRPMAIRRAILNCWSVADEEEYKMYVRWKETLTKMVK